MDAILIIEDQAENVLVITTMLETCVQPEQLTTVASAEEAIVLLRQGYIPSIVFVDLVLAGMDGWAFLVEAQKFPSLSGARFVAVSAYLDEPMREQALALGFADCYIKPLHLGSFITGVKGLLHKEG